MAASALVARILGAQHILFANPTRDADGLVLPPLEATVARCTLRESAGPVERGTPLADVLWVQCGRVAAPDHEGTFLCETHMRYWHCEVCGIQTPDFGPDHTCVSCCAN